MPPCSYGQAHCSEPCSCAKLSTLFACSDASISSATSLRQRRRRSRGGLYRGATLPQPEADSQLRSRRSQLEAVPSGKQLLVPVAGAPAWQGVHHAPAWQGLHPHSRLDRAQRTPSAEMQPLLESPRRCLSMPQGGALMQRFQSCLPSAKAGTFGSVPQRCCAGIVCIPCSMLPSVE